MKVDPISSLSRRSKLVGAKPGDLGEGGGPRNRSASVTIGMPSYTFTRTNDFSAQGEGAWPARPDSFAQKRVLMMLPETLSHLSQ
jgi:hypothetical protein